MGSSRFVPTSIATLSRIHGSTSAARTRSRSRGSAHSFSGDPQPGVGGPTIADLLVGELLRDPPGLRYAPEEGGEGGLSRVSGRACGGKHAAIQAGFSEK